MGTLFFPLLFATAFIRVFRRKKHTFVGRMRVRIGLIF